MYQLIASPVLSGNLSWQARKHWPRDEEEGLRVVFRVYRRHSRRNVSNMIADLLKSDGIEWLRPSRDVWTIDTAELRRWLDAQPDRLYPQSSALGLLDDLLWLTGVVACQPELEHRTEDSFGRPQEMTYLRLEIAREEFELDKKTRIFLSHKGADKPMVRRFHAVLEELGHAPWLDEEDMPAGSELHRAILKGMEESCAAVFFITEKFVDEKYLKGEINYAIAQKTERGDRFAIITLVFDTEQERKIEVPSLLQPYVWKHAATELDGLREIIRGLPVTLGPVRWR